MVQRRKGVRVSVATKCLRAAPWLLVFVGSAVILVGCGRRDSDHVRLSPERFVWLDLGRKGSPEIIHYYLSPFKGEGAPESARDSLLVVRRGGRMYVDLDMLAEADSISSTTLKEEADARSRVGWDEFMRFVDRTYNRVRRIPATREDLDRVVQADNTETDWFRIEVIGVMSSLRREVAVRRADVEEALRARASDERSLVYPVETTFIADHYEGIRRVETTAMRKNRNGSWDFFAYDSTGALATQTLPRPRSLEVPGQCVGCHYGSKLYEPEKSFPARAGDGPHGPRAIFVDEAVRRVAPVRHLDEHRRRSDHVLGLYGTILAAELLLEREAGSLEAEGVALLERLGL